MFQINEYQTRLMMHKPLIKPKQSNITIFFSAYLFLIILLSHRFGFIKVTAI